jgi:hypothetical protein
MHVATNERNEEHIKATGLVLERRNEVSHHLLHYLLTSPERAFV